MINFDEIENQKNHQKIYDWIIDNIENVESKSDFQEVVEIYRTYCLPYLELSNIKYHNALGEMVVFLDNSDEFDSEITGNIWSNIAKILIFSME